MKRLLIAGYGDIARRVAARLPPGLEMRALSRRHGQDLDRPETLRAIGGWADAVLHLAPPPGAGSTDSRTANLLAALGCEPAPARLVYASTSGVYGDCAGARVDEDRPLRPLSARAQRRADAERQVTAWSADHNVELVILRIPGIYAADRLPLARLRAGTPLLRAQEDVYTNHIHAEDLAAIARRALQRAAPPGVYNAADDSELKLGDWFDLLADRLGLPRAPRIARAQAPGRIPAASLAFMQESRRLVNRRMKELLGVVLRYPTVFDGLASLPVARNVP